MPVAGEISVPPLKTLALSPSWLNRAANVDRSACIEIHAREVARLIFRQSWRKSKSSSAKLASATVIVTPAHLSDWLSRRLPRKLIGDQRTPKSNAMKHPCDPQPGAGGRRHLKPGDTPWRAARDYRGTTFINPNKGAAATKRIFHDLCTPRIDLSRRVSSPNRESNWSQTFTLERWRLKSKSTRRRADASNPPDPVHTFLLCPRCRTKRRMLLLPVAHERELNDAHLAQCWLRCIDAHPRWRRLALNNAALRLQIESITNRYAVLFAPRQFCCIDCLGARYGEVKRSRRPRRPVITMPPPTADGSSEMPMAFNIVHKQLRDSIRRGKAVEDIIRMLRQSEDKADGSEIPQFDSDLLVRLITAEPRNFSPLQRAMRSALRQSRTTKRKARDETSRSDDH
jgi:hypothetical protein